MLPSYFYSSTCFFGNTVLLLFSNICQLHSIINRKSFFKMSCFLAAPNYPAVFQATGKGTRHWHVFFFSFSPPSSHFCSFSIPFTTFWCISLSWRMFFYIYQLSVAFRLIQFDLINFWLYNQLQLDLFVLIIRLLPLPLI